MDLNCLGIFNLLDNTKSLYITSPSSTRLGKPSGAIPCCTPPFEFSSCLPPVLIILTPLLKVLPYCIGPPSAKTSREAFKKFIALVASTAFWELAFILASVVEASLSNLFFSLLALFLPINAEPIPTILPTAAPIPEPIAVPTGPPIEPINPPIDAPLPVSCIICPASPHPSYPLIFCIDFLSAIIGFDNSDANWLVFPVVNCVLARAL